MRLEAGRRGSHLRRRGRAEQLALQGLGDRVRDVVFEREDALELALVGPGPEMHVAIDVDELGRHAQGVALPSDAALEERLHVEPRAELPRLEVLVLEREDRGARGDVQAVDVAEHVDQFVGDAVR